MIDWLQLHWMNVLYVAGVIAGLIFIILVQRNTIKIRKQYPRPSKEELLEQEKKVMSIGTPYFSREWWFTRRFAQIEVNEVGITTHEKGDRTRSIRWDELTEARIINTDTGPFTEDIWIALITPSSAVMVPCETNAFSEVISKLTNLKGFNGEAYFTAMICADNREAILWMKETTAQNSE